MNNSIVKTIVSPRRDTIDHNVSVFNEMLRDVYRRVSHGPEMEIIRELSEELDPKL